MGVNNIVFTPTADDLSAGYRLVQNKGLPRFFLSIGLALLILLAVIWLIDGNIEVGIALFMACTIMIAATVLIAIARFLGIPRISRKTIRLDKTLNTEHRVEWDQDAITVTNKNGCARLPLRDFVCRLEDQNIILLFSNQNMFRFYPRRAFPDEITWMAIRETLENADIPTQWPPK
jgi:hypothetical protein